MGRAAVSGPVEKVAERRYPWLHLLRELLADLVSDRVALVGALGFALFIGLALAGNLIAAGIAGTLVPLTLKFFKLDPALASAVIVTTVTDCVGFGLFLGLATLFLPYLK